MSNDQSIVEFNAELAGASNVNKVLKEAGAKDQRDALKLVPFDKLVILKDFNARTHNAARESRVRSIADDMKANGYRPTEPMQVFIDDQGQIIVAEGHTRYDAAALAISEGATNLEFIPVLPMKPGTSMEDLTINLAVANEKERLDALGYSILMKRLTTTFGNSNAEASKKLGIDPKYGTQMLLLAGAPSRLREMIATGIASATLVITLMEEHGAEEALRLLEEGLKESTSTNKEGQKVVRKKNIKEKKPETAEDLRNKLIVEHALSTFQLVEFILAIDMEELNEAQKKEKMQGFLDKLDIIVHEVKTKVEAATEGQE